MRPTRTPGLPPTFSQRFRWKWLIVVSIFILLVGAFIRYPIILVTSNHNGYFLVSTYRLEEDDFDGTRLRLLRKRENLDKVVKGASTQFETIVRLRHWAHTQWQSSGAFYYPPWDAVEILDLSRKYKNNGFCAQYAIVFLQACQSMGLHARYVELVGHFTVAVWSDEYDGWIAMDPTNDIYYERRDVPMRAGQICRAYWDDNLKGIFSVGYDGAKKAVTKEDLASYRLYAIVKRANQLTNPPLIEVNGGADRVLIHEDDFHRYPLIGRDKLRIGSPYLAWKEKDAKEQSKDKPLSDDPDDFRYPLNQTLLFEARRDAEKGQMKIVMHAENSPTFQSFLVNLDETHWEPTVDNEMFWGLTPGFNHLQVRIKTKYGWEGTVSSMSVYYKPAWSI